VSVARVSKSTGNTTKKQEGIPFYTKVGRYKQTTIFREQWIEATLSLTVREPLGAGGNEKPAERPAGQYGYEFKSLALEKLHTIQESIVKATDDAQVLKAIADLKALAQDASLSGRDPVGTPVSNTVESIAVVDYSQIYYVNAAQPWFGSAGLTSKLNEDGTLTEASLTTESKMGEGIASFLPLKEYLTGKFVESAKAAGSEALLKTVTPGAQFRAALSLERKGVAYKFTRLSPKDFCTDAGVCAPIKFDRDTGNYTTEDLGGGGPEKKENDKSISFSGTVELPKAGGGD